MADILDAQDMRLSRVEWPRVCHLIGSLSIGGAERQVVNLLNELPPEQAVVIAIGKCAGPLAAQLRPGILIQVLTVRWRTLPLSIWQLSRMLRKLKVDVLQTHMFWANLTGTMAGGLAGVPVVVTTEHGKNEQKPGWARLVERLVISRLADKRICVSEDILGLRNRKDGIPLGKLCVIPNGTPVRQKKLLQDTRLLTIGTLGRLIAAKDFPTLIEAAGQLRDNGIAFRLVVVGEGPEHTRILSEIKMRGLQNLIELPGFSADVESWLRQFDIYVMSSIREGQPLSLLEAMAVGLPIVSTSVGGIPDTVEDGKEAILVPPGDATAIARALARLADDLPLRQRLGKAAHDRLVKDYSISASLRKHLDVYKSILDAKGRQR